MDKVMEREKRPVGRPPTRKQLLTLRLEPEVVEHFKGYGKGWLQRVNDALKDTMEKQQALAVIEVERQAIEEKRQARLARRREARRAARRVAR